MSAQPNRVADAPVYQATMAEMEDLSRLLANASALAMRFGAVRIDPPADWHHPSLRIHDKSRFFVRLQSLPEAPFLPKPAASTASTASAASTSASASASAFVADAAATASPASKPKRRRPKRTVADHDHDYEDDVILVTQPTKKHRPLTMHAAQNLPDRPKPTNFVPARGALPCQPSAGSSSAFPYSVGPSPAGPSPAGPSPAGPSPAGPSPAGQAQHPAPVSAAVPFSAPPLAPRPYPASAYSAHQSSTGASFSRPFANASTSVPPSVAAPPHALHSSRVATPSAHASNVVSSAAVPSGAAVPYVTGASSAPLSATGAPGYGMSCAARLPPPSSARPPLPSASPPLGKDAPHNPVPVPPTHPRDPSVARPMCIPSLPLINTPSPAPALMSAPAPTRCAPPVLQPIVQRPLCAAATPVSAGKTSAQEPSRSGDRRAGDATFSPSHGHTDGRREQHVAPANANAVLPPFSQLHAGEISASPTSQMYANSVPARSVHVNQNAPPYRAADAVAACVTVHRHATGAPVSDVHSLRRVPRVGMGYDGADALRSSEPAAGRHHAVARTAPTKSESRAAGDQQPVQQSTNIVQPSLPFLRSKPIADVRPPLPSGNANMHSSPVTPSAGRLLSTRAPISTATAPTSSPAKPIPQHVSGTPSNGVPTNVAEGSAFTPSLQGTSDARGNRTDVPILHGQTDRTLSPYVTSPPSQLTCAEAAAIVQQTEKAPTLKGGCDGRAASEPSIAKTKAIAKNAFSHCKKMDVSNLCNSSTLRPSCRSPTHHTPALQNLTPSYQCVPLLGTSPAPTMPTPSLSGMPTVRPPTSTLAPAPHASSTVAVTRIPPSATRVGEAMHASRDTSGVVEKDSTQSTGVATCVQPGFLIHTGKVVSNRIDGVETPGHMQPTSSAPPVQPTEERVVVQSPVSLGTGKVVPVGNCHVLERRNSTTCIPKADHSAACLKEEGTVKRGSGPATSQALPKFSLRSKRPDDPSLWEARAGSEPQGQMLSGPLQSKSALMPSEGKAMYARYQPPTARPSPSQSIDLDANGARDQDMSSTGKKDQMVLDQICKGVAHPKDEGDIISSVPYPANPTSTHEKKPAVVVDDKDVVLISPEKESDVEEVIVKRATKAKSTRSKSSYSKAKRKPNRSAASHVLDNGQDSQGRLTKQITFPDSPSPMSLRTYKKQSSTLIARLRRTLPDLVSSTDGDTASRHEDPKHVKARVDRLEKAFWTVMQTGLKGRSFGVAYGVDVEAEGAFDPLENNYAEWYGRSASESGEKVEPKLESEYKEKVKEDEEDEIERADSFSMSSEEDEILDEGTVHDFERAPAMKRVKKSFDAPYMPKSHAGNLNRNGLLRHLPLMPGINHTMFYIGQMFTRFCWHVEDAYLNSVSYLHEGSSEKVWYAVPPAFATKFDEYTRNQVFAPKMVETEGAAPVLLMNKTTLFHPGGLREHGIEVFRVIHRPGSFVLTAPRAYHAGFNCGFNVAEAVNYASCAWFPVGRMAAIFARQVYRPLCVGWEYLLFHEAKSLRDRGRECTKVSKELAKNAGYVAEELRIVLQEGEENIRKFAEGKNGRVVMMKDVDVLVKNTQLGPEFGHGAGMICTTCGHACHFYAEVCGSCQNNHKAHCVYHLKTDRLCREGGHRSVIVRRHDPMLLLDLLENLEEMARIAVTDEEKYRRTKHFVRTWDTPLKKSSGLRLHMNLSEAASRIPPKVGETKSGAGPSTRRDRRRRGRSCPDDDGGESKPRTRPRARSGKRKAERKADDSDFEDRRAKKTRKTEERPRRLRRPLPSPRPRTPTDEEEDHPDIVFLKNFGNGL